MKEVLRGNREVGSEVELHLGLLEALMGRWEAALAHFDQGRISTDDRFVHYLTWYLTGRVWQVRPAW